MLNPNARPVRIGRALACLLGILMSGCGQSGSSRTAGAQGTVRVDGSSTVFPITEAVAEEFQKLHPGIRVAVGLSGTGGGFKKFALGEIDVNDASRPIRESELADARANGVEFIELSIAFDGLSVVVNPKNDWVDHLTVAELREIWKPESTVRKWNDVRPDWPDRDIRLYGPGHDSGTFDYFTEAVVGKARACRADYTASEDDNTLVMGVAGEAGSLGYFGFAYYIENKDKLRAVPIDGGRGPVAPSEETIRNGTYAPLSRPLLIYVTLQAAGRPEVQAFIDFFIESDAELVSQVGYVPLPGELMALVKQRFKSRRTGTMYEGIEEGAHVTLDELLAK